MVPIEVCCDLAHSRVGIKEAIVGIRKFFAFISSGMILMKIVIDARCSFLYMRILLGSAQSSPCPAVIAHRSRDAFPTNYDTGSPWHFGL
jgi:hypothetical protein